MEWLDEADRLLQQFRERERAIAEKEGDIFLSLWEELKRHVNAARMRKAFAGITTNGQPESRVITFPVDHSSPIFTLPKSATVTLDHEKHQIVADIHNSGRGGVDVREVFQLDIERDGAIGLKRGNTFLPLKEAAIHILWPLLYPELAQYSGPKKPALVAMKVPGI